MENCSICGKKLNFWNTQLKKYEGKKVCTSCAWKTTKQNVAKINEERKAKGNPAKSIGKRLLFAGLALIFFVIGLATFPIGIIFWIFSVLLFIQKQLVITGGVVTFL